MFLVSVSGFFSRFCGSWYFNNPSMSQGNSFTQRHSVSDQTLGVRETLPDLWKINCDFLYHIANKRLEVFGASGMVYIRAFPICVCDPITFNPLIGYIIIFSVVFRDTPQRNTCCNNSLAKTAARPIYLCGWLPWKALQEGLGEKVVAQEGEGEEGKEEKEDYKTNHLVTRVFRSSFACFSTTDVCSVQDLAETGLLTLRILNSF